MEDKKHIVLSMLEQQWSDIKNDYAKHKAKVEQALNWWNSSAVNSEGKAFVGCRVKVNGVNCLCTRVDLRGAPYFNAIFEVRPYSVNENAGSGCGIVHTVDFMANTGLSAEVCDATADK